MNSNTHTKNINTATWTRNLTGLTNQSWGHAKVTGVCVWARLLLGVRMTCTAFCMILSCIFPSFLFCDFWIKIDKFAYISNIFSAVEKCFIAHCHCYTTGACYNFLDHSEKESGQIIKLWFFLNIVFSLSFVFQPLKKCHHCDGADYYCNPGYRLVHHIHKYHTGF